MKNFVLTLLLVIFSSLALAADEFVVRDIKMNGLQQISEGTVLNYLPIQVGETFEPANSNHIIRTLYDTGFFKHVALSQEGNTLVVSVVERPMLSSIKVSGNKEIDDEQVKNLLKEYKLEKGTMFDRSTLDKFIQGLRKMYFSYGHYNVEITPEITENKNNRVSVKIKVVEGESAKIKEIKIIGNEAFPSKTLLRKFYSTTPGLKSLFTKSDQYSKQKLDADLEILRSYYMDRGYVKFQIESTQVSLTPDKKTVHIVIRVNEGDQYTVSDVKFTGNLILSKEELRDIVKIKKGDVFSRKKIAMSDTEISKAVGNFGYAFADVNAHPEFDDEKNEVVVIFTVDPGQRAYVRQISFSGNIKTSDEVLRREMRQQEGALFSVSKVQSSQRHIDLLQYMQNTQASIEPVPGIDDQVDLDFKVNETSSGQFTIEGGYGTNGFIFNLKLHQDNVFGSGRTIGIESTNSEIVRNVDLSYYNPYLTTNGIGGGGKIYYTRFTPGKQNVTTYTADRYGANYGVFIPMSDDDRVRFGLEYRNLHISLPGDESVETKKFIDDHGNSFDQIILSTSWRHLGYDRSIFPTKGLTHVLSGEVSLPVTNNTLTYYKVNYRGHWYQPLGKDFIFSALGHVGFGDGFDSYDNLPFFENFFAGGIGSASPVRGYETNTLGPRDSKDKPFGGNFHLGGSLGMIVPNPFNPEMLRPTLFVDAGQVYNSHDHVSFDDIRYSVGISFDIRTPLVPIVLSMAVPINKKSGDETEAIQFFLGASF